MSEILHIREEDLELYAFGTLPESELAAVKAHIAVCHECTAKLAQALGNVAVLALAAPQETPPEKVKDQLFARIANEGSGSSQTIARLQKRETEKNPRRPRRNWNWVLIPAVAGLALFCAVLYQKNRTLVNELSEARRVAADFERERLHVMGLVNALSAKDTETIRLASTKDGVPGSSAVVHYNKRLGKVIYSAELPELSVENAYQMWLVPTSGGPISAGTFHTDEARHADPREVEVPVNIDPKAFAVTMEPAGGVSKPTGKIVLLGAASKD
ncbi:MAG: anti-sigma factor [Candidatus Acidiferrum sp.]